MKNDFIQVIRRALIEVNEPYAQMLLDAFQDAGYLEYRNFPSDFEGKNEIIRILVRFDPSLKDAFIIRYNTRGQFLCIEED